MRFVSPRDYNTILKINTELVNKIIDISIILFKLNQTLTKTNSYGEGSKKTWYPGVEIPCLIDRGDTQATEALQTVDTDQDSSFSFLRNELQTRNVYPEQGDIIYFDKQYYEIHNTNEVQLWGGRTEYHHAIVCNTHLTRQTNLQLEIPII